MDTIEAALGETLLVAVGLAVIQLAVILLLVEANLILRLAGTLIRGLRSFGVDREGYDPSTGHRSPAEPVTKSERS